MIIHSIYLRRRVGKNGGIWATTLDTSKVTIRSLSDSDLPQLLLTSFLLVQGSHMLLCLRSTHPLQGIFCENVPSSPPHFQNDG